MSLFPDPPKPEYPKYTELWEQAQHTANRQRFVNPADLGHGGRYDKVVTRRGSDWCLSVLGHFPGIGGLTFAEAELLVLADEAGIDPPLPKEIAEARARRAAYEQDAAEWRAEIARRDQAAWDEALQQRQPGVEVDVYDNPTARARHGQSHHLGHAVPRQDVYSGTRRVRTHRAGRALCETETRPRPLALQDSPSPGPATCVSCLNWTTKVRSTR